MLHLRWITVLITAVLLVGLSSVAFLQPPAPGEEAVLIGFETDLPAPQAKIMNQLVALDGEVTREFTIVDAVAARVPARAVEVLAETPGVAYVEPDSEVYALQTTLQQQTVPWGIDRVFGTDSYPFAAWEHSKGADIEVAVIDTGIDQNHEDLSELSGGTNTIDETHWGLDEHGHGTLMAGVIAALDNNRGVVGISPEANLYSVKALNEEGAGTLSSIVAGIEWTVERDIPVLNMSLGTTEYSETLEGACEAAYNKGHLLVAATGNVNDNNEGHNVHYPAAFPSVVAVTASDRGDELAAFSSHGPEVELIAPGVDIVSTFPENKYAKASGTSLAAPHASGTAALAWATDTQLSHEDIREILHDTAEDLGLEENYQGYGLVRADRAVTEVISDPRGSIEGTVLDDATNEPAEKATVEVGETEHSATTGIDGEYLIEDIPEGVYELTASAEGYYMRTVEHIEVKEDKTTIVDFALEPKPEYTLKVDINPESTGTIKVQGEEVELPYSEKYYEGTEVALEAEAAKDWDFDKWTLEEEEFSEKTIAVTIDADKTAVAHFHDWIMLPEKYDVALDEKWAINFNREFSEDEIDGIVMEKDEEFIPITVEMMPKDKQAVVTPVNSYLPDARYNLRIFLNKLNRYKMYFHTEEE